MPSMKSIAESAMKPLGDVLPKPDLPFAQPSKGMPDLSDMGNEEDFDSPLTGDEFEMY